MKTKSQKFFHLFVAVLCVLGCSGADDPVAIQQEEVGNAAKVKGAFMFADSGVAANNTPLPIGQLEPLFQKLVIFEFSISELTVNTVSDDIIYSGPIADVKFSGDSGAAGYLNREVAPTFRGVTLIIRLLGEANPVALTQVDIFPPFGPDQQEGFALTFTGGLRVFRGGSDIVLDDSFTPQATAFMQKSLRVGSQVINAGVLSSDCAIMTLEGFRDLELQQ